MRFFRRCQWFDEFSSDIKGKIQIFGYFETVFFSWETFDEVFAQEIMVQKMHPNLTKWVNKNVLE